LKQLDTEDRKVDIAHGAYLKLVQHISFKIVLSCENETACCVARKRMTLSRGDVGGRKRAAACFAIDSR